MKQWMLTYPQCGTVTKQEFADVFPDATYVNCVCESHKDGTPHLHMIISLAKPLTKKALGLRVSKAYPNASKRIHYNPVRSMRHCQEYIQKEDDSPYIKGILPRKKIRGLRAIMQYYAKHPDEYRKVLESILSLEL